MKGIFTETLIEFLDRRQQWFLIIVTIIAAGIIYFAVADRMKLVENEMASESSLIDSASNSLSIFVTALMMLAVISVTFVIPRIVRKRRIDFYLSKPITRSSLYYGKITSLAVIYSTMILICGSIVAGTLHFQNVLSFSNSIYILLTGWASFLVWLSIVSFIGFLTRSVPMCLTVFGGLWIIQLLLKHRTELGIEQKAVQISIDALYYVLPKTSEMSGISIELAKGAQSANFLPAFTSLVLAAILIYTSHFQFKRRDF